MANLIVRNIDDSIVKALKLKAGMHGISAEAEHRQILKEALLFPPKKMFSEVLAMMPDIGRDTDFTRVSIMGTGYLTHFDISTGSTTAGSVSIVVVDD